MWILLLVLCVLHVWLIWYWRYFWVSNPCGYIYRIICRSFDFFSDVVPDSTLVSRHSRYMEFDQDFGFLRFWIPGTVNSYGLLALWASPCWPWWHLLSTVSDFLPTFMYVFGCFVIYAFNSPSLLIGWFRPGVLWPSSTLWCDWVARSLEIGRKFVASWTCSTDLSLHT